VDTTNILFICGGAFSGLEKIISARGKGSGIGFGSEVRSPTSGAWAQSCMRWNPRICCVSA